MITSNDLELRTELTLGTLESNAEAIQLFVLDRLKDYTPENYIGKADEAKADRAVLNNAEKALNTRRLELERQYMAPFATFKAIITDTCKALKQASGALDDIVKAEEEREKTEKAEKIQEYWDASGFTLFDVTQVYNSKWLNKTTKLKDVYAEIDQIQKKTFDDLAVIDNFNKDDIPLIKAVYLESLDLASALAKANQLKDNRDRLAKEAKQREVLETRNALDAQRKSEVEDINASIKEDRADLLVAAALDLPENQPEKKQIYACVFTGTADNLLLLRREMTKLNITYTKLEPKGNGVYVEEK